MFRLLGSVAEIDKTFRIGFAMRKVLSIFRTVNSAPPWKKGTRIEPTNNTAERALRPAVIYRKLSFGTQSESGSRFIERMLTVSETCRLQNRSAYDYLTKAVTAYFSKQAAPSLLPNP